MLTLNSFLLSHTDHGEEVVLAAVSCDGQVLSSLVLMASGVLVWNYRPTFGLFNFILE